jgi:lysophospholipase L1-like esterase
MGVGRKATFAALTAIVFLLAVEGVARVVWAVLERRAFARTVRGGEAVLRNDAINFMKQPDGVYGYVLKPGVDLGGMVINAQGFAQRETVPLSRRTGILRVAAMGESTTQGHNTDSGNYPVYLRRILKRLGSGFEDVELINAGVSGWVSDQVALQAEHNLVRYRPDIVVLYTGWNDFHTYHPYGPPPKVTHFDQVYGGRRWLTASRLRSVELLGAVAGALSRPGIGLSAAIAPPGEASSRVVYRFYGASLDRIVRAYRTTDPSVKIAICTLIGRWPLGTLADYREGVNGRTHWMKLHDLSPGQAAAALARFNDLIRQYSRDHALILIDAAGAFESLDRAKLQWDSAHMHAEGYELLAEVIYRRLVEAGAVAGRRSERLEELVLKYTRRPTDGR